jgi:hypothetical protein
VADEKIFKEICTPQLYKDCLVSDVNKFLAGLEKGPFSRKSQALTTTKTLRIYASQHRQGATYKDLFVGTAEWLDVGNARGIDHGVSSEMSDQISFDYFRNDVAALRIKLGKAKRNAVFGSVERICMTSTGDQNWGTHHSHPATDNNFTTPALPIRLLCLPSVKHFCQSIMRGPLSLGWCTLKTKNPPKIATFHTHHINLWADKNNLPPIILGAVNRYMSTGMRFHTITPDLIWTEGTAEIFTPLFNFVAGPSVGIENDGHMDSVQADTVSFANTSIEVYNFVDWYPGPTADPNLTRAERLALVQKFVDKHLGKWKGRVTLKDKADCPPCSACGYAYK